MSIDDVQIIFGNIAELAVFSDQFCDTLEQALMLNESEEQEEDHIGALFLQLIPELEKTYDRYVNKHPAALAHLRALPQTPALASYLTQTQALASFDSYAWDLPSLLIKPVQRLPEYSTLLGAIMNGTPDTHSDKENFRRACTRMEEVAYNIREGRRRPAAVEDLPTSKEKPVNVGVAARAKGANGETVVDNMHRELKRAEVFSQQLGKTIVDWARMTSNVMRSLRAWAIGFGKVAGLSEEQGNGAFDAFVGVVDAHLLPLCHQLEADVNAKLLKELAYLLMMMNQPLKLLASVAHPSVTNATTKKRPPPASLSVSTNHHALRAQLVAELPAYLKLLHRGLEIQVRRLAQIQAEFWRNVRDQWADLWRMLGVRGHINAEYATMEMWQGRWQNVNEVIKDLKITRPAGGTAAAGSLSRIRRRSLVMLGRPSGDIPQNSAVSVVLEDVDEAPSPPSSLLQPQVPISKRKHALHELLSSERAYASDLALVRDIHIPLAIGHPVPLISSTALGLSLSSWSDSASSSLEVSPMSTEDVRTIFSNITELALFSDHFCDTLEQALGSTLDGGEGEDWVGALFLGIIPELEKPYNNYIKKHPAALAHLQALPRTSALTSYLNHTRTLASFHSHAWDLTSLLIRPVQRLLTYSLLLRAIVDETPDTHGDKENLRRARIRMEEVAHNATESRRRAEIVKQVLMSKEKGVKVAAINLTRMKSLRHTARKAQDVRVNGEATLVEKMRMELKRVDMLVQQLGKKVVDWAKMTGNVVRSLRLWAIVFGKVIGLSAEQESEAFDVFVVVVETHLLPLCHRLEADVNEKLLKELARLLMTMNQPLKLLASMEEQEPFHYHLMTMNVSAKNRPAPALLAASTNYLALRGQLAAELPAYLKLLHRGLAVEVRRLAHIQAEFWRHVRDQWADLWEMLRVSEDKIIKGHEETMAVWQSRWWDVNENVSGLQIVKPPEKQHQPLISLPYSGRHSQMTATARETTHRVIDMLQSLNIDTAHVTTPSIMPGGGDLRTGGLQLSPIAEEQEED